MSLNTGSLFDAMVAAQPDTQAVVLPGRGANARGGYRRVSFGAAGRHCNRLARALHGDGVVRGQRVLVMVTPGFTFAPLIFALFKIGAVPVLIDPGMGWRNLVHAIRQVHPEVFIGIPKAHLLRWLAPSAFRSVQTSFSLGCGMPGARPLGRLAEGASPDPFRPADTDADETAAILFTTGSTGPAKGVVYTHRIFTTQVQLLREVYGLGPGDCDLPCFPLFALFSLALGATIVIPEIDFTRPAQVDPERIVRPILDREVTYSFGSPALWRRVAEYCFARRLRLPSLRQLFMAGAPVAPALHELLLRRVLPPGAQTHTPYGATECLPVATIAGTEVVADTAALHRSGRGICVGRAMPGLQVKILALRDAPIPAWDDALVQPPGEPGEIVVRGAVVTPAYAELPDATALAKIRQGDAFWHRMGDVGYIDAQGRLWFCGRKAHCVRTPQKTLFSVCCEAIFNQHPAVARSALVGIGDAAAEQQEPVIVIEPKPGCWPRFGRGRARLVAAILALGAANPMTSGIRRVLFYRRFPVDIRHNAKIRREELAAWATRRCGPAMAAEARAPTVAVGPPNPAP